MSWVRWIVSTALGWLGFPKTIMEAVQKALGIPSLTLTAALVAVGLPTFPVTWWLWIVWPTLKFCRWMAIYFGYWPPFKDDNQQGKVQSDAAHLDHAEVSQEDGQHASSDEGHTASHAPGPS